MTSNTWREFLAELEVGVHESAELYPDMAEAELDELAKDIARSGIRSGVRILQQGGPSDQDPRLLLLDGRQRCAAVWRGFDPGDREAVLSTMIGSGARVSLHDSRAIEIAEPIRLKDAPDFDPYLYVISVNSHRRHLSRAQKQEVIMKMVKAHPEMSDRLIASTAKASHVTVGAVRAKLEKTGQVAKLETRTDIAGHQRPAIWSGTVVHPETASETGNQEAPANASLEGGLQLVNLTTQPTKGTGQETVTAPVEIVARHDLDDTAAADSEVSPDAVREPEGAQDTPMDEQAPATTSGDVGTAHPVSDERTLDTTPDRQTAATTQSTEALGSLIAWLTTVWRDPTRPMNSSLDHRIKLAVICLGALGVTLEELQGAFSHERIVR